MSKKGREKFRVYEFESFSEDDDMDYGDFDLKALSRDVHSIDRDEIFEKEQRLRTRRKSARQIDMRHLNAQFEDWDEPDHQHHW